MKIRCLLIFLFTGFTLSGHFTLSAQQNNMQGGKLNNLTAGHSKIIVLKHFIDSVAQNYLTNPANSSLSIGVSDGTHTERYFYGETIKGTHQLPDGNSLYEIASISKTFTGLLLAHAVNTGKLRLDDDIREYLPGSYPNLQYKGTPIKIVNLSNHTATFPHSPADLEKQPSYDAANPYLNYSKAMIYKYLHNFKPDTVPGLRATYSNLGFAVLGTILENIYHQPIEELLHITITAPLKMDNTFFNLPASKKNFLTKGYKEKTGTEVPHWNLKNFKAAGGLKSDINDMLLYLNANMNELNTDYTLTQKQTDDRGDFQKGLAWTLEPLANQQLIWHNGGTAGYRSFCGFIKNQQTGVVVLSNSASDVDELATTILTFMLKNKGV